MTDMVAAYSVKPVDLSSADQVKANAAGVLAFRRAFYSKPASKPKAPKQPGILEYTVWPQWVSEFVHGAPPVDSESDRTIYPTHKSRPQIERIVRIVAKFYNLTTDDIYSIRRTRNIVRPRQVACYLAKTMTLRSLPEIGRKMGGRDHTTILHAVRKIEHLRETYDQMADDIRDLRQLVLDDLARRNSRSPASL